MVRATLSTRWQVRGENFSCSDTVSSNSRCSARNRHHRRISFAPMRALAMSCTPRLLIADEATTALDVTIQAQILDLMQDVTEQTGAALLIITHNLGIVARYADKVAVMYAGKLREVSDAAELYAEPQHPYTVGLLRSVPRLDSDKGAPLTPIAGEIPDLTDLPPGCAFNPRCQWAVDRCGVEDPVLEEVSSGRQVACFEHARVALNV